MRIVILIPKNLQAHRNEQNWKEKDRIGQKQTETDKNGLRKPGKRKKRRETDRNRQKLTENNKTNRNT